VLKTSLRLASLAIGVAAVWTGSLLAQMTVTGTVAGNVVDPSGQAIATAKVTLTSPRTSETRSAVTNELGAFTLAAVQPDTYNMRVEQRGFKVYSRSGLVVSANERVAVGDIVLQVGDVTETISVAAETAQVETTSSEHSASLTQTQVQNLTARGRDVVSIPGRPGFGRRQLWH